MNIEWIDGSVIRVKTDDDGVTISANKEGLLSLAGQLTTLAKGLSGDHFHYDQHNSLEDGSADLVIEKTSDK
ncbi:MAG: hypothetical protein J6S49_08085 [Erysipelotrichaceae bacterium]|nr:hypothetical protein [Erysipelotrichaceae bacterium]